MTVSKPDEWIQARIRYEKLCANLILSGYSMPFKKLLAEYCDGKRKYHNFSHILACLKEFDEVSDQAENPDLLEYAIWFHDLIYDTHAKSGKNERRSAERAIHPLLGKQQQEDRYTIISLILATTHDNDGSETSIDEKLIADIDLSILGKPEEVFDEYEIQIRQEYAWVAENVFKRKRIDILLSFLDRPAIYQTAHFKEKYEETSRKNLNRSLEKLTGVKIT